MRLRRKSGGRDAPHGPGVSIWRPRAWRVNAGTSKGSPGTTPLCDRQGRRSTEQEAAQSRAAGRSGQSSLWGSGHHADCVKTTNGLSF